MRCRHFALGLLVALLIAAAPTALADHLYAASLSGANEVPANSSMAVGTVYATIADDGTTVSISGQFSGLSSEYATSHIRVGAVGTNGSVIVALNPTSLFNPTAGSTFHVFEQGLNTFTFSASQISALENDGLYVSVSSATFGDGEIRGQLAAAREVVSLNEITVSTSGTDTEFVEIGGVPGTSLDGLTLLAIEGDRDSSRGFGVIDRAIFLMGVIPTDGYWLAASPEAVAQFGLAAADVDQTINNDTFEDGSQTILLVTGFTSFVGDDIDTDDDGTADVTPWNAVVDGIALLDAGANDTPADGAYSDMTLGPNGASLPPGAYRSPNLTGSYVSLEFEAPSASATPGKANGGGTDNKAEAFASGMTITVANPVVAQSHVRYAVGAAGPARLEAFDLLGRRVALLADGLVPGHTQVATFDVGRLPVGVYVLRLTGDAGVATRTVTVVR